MFGGAHAECGDLFGGVGVGRVARACRGALVLGVALAERDLNTPYS